MEVLFQEQNPHDQMWKTEAVRLPIFNDIGKLEGEAVIAKLHSDCLEEFSYEIDIIHSSLV